jgi:hypothetical protein
MLGELFARGLSRNYKEEFFFEYIVVCDAFLPAHTSVKF